MGDDLGSTCMNFIMILQIKKKIVYSIYMCLIYIKDNGKEILYTDEIDVNKKHIQQELNIAKTKFYKSWWSFIRKFYRSRKREFKWKIDSF